MASHEDTAALQAIIMRYAESLLYSKLTALQTEIESLAEAQGPQPLLTSAEPFVGYATIFTELSRLALNEHAVDFRERHHCSRTISYFRSQNVHIERTRRAPSVMGDEVKQLTCIKRFCKALPKPRVAHFRTRSNRFVMTLEFERHIPLDIAHITRTQYPQRLLMQHLSEERLRAYVLLLSCQEIGVHVRSKRANTNRLSFSWNQAQQLQIPLDQQK